MATKNISITEEAYKRLASLKNENESFSEVIVRVVKKNNWRDFYGCMSGKEGEEFEQHILENRKIHAKQHEERVKKILKEMYG